MITLLAVVHIFVGVALVLFVLLQDPKGGAMGVFSGGSSSSSFFGASGASNFLSTTTKWLAVLFAISCLTLTYLTAHRGGSVMDTYVPPPVVPSATPAPSQQSVPGTNPALDPNAKDDAPKPEAVTKPTEQPKK